MRFWSHKTTRDWVGSKSKDFYRKQIDLAIERKFPKNCLWQMVTENFWEVQRRPYYNVWPSIVPMLVKLNLAVDSAAIKLPLPALNIRLAVGKELGEIKSILVGHSAVTSKAGEFDSFTVWLDTGEIEKGLPVLTYINIPQKKGVTIEEALSLLPTDSSYFKGKELAAETRLQAIRLVCTLCLLEQDKSIIEPDVLVKDEKKEINDLIVDRAHRRGKIGWNIGKGLEVIPHYRRPHPALVWCGKGREEAKIVMRKGTLVHRDVIERVPTGHLVIKE